MITRTPIFGDAGAETVALKRLLGGLRKRAETIGRDDAGRALIVRTVTKAIVARRPFQPTG